MDRRDAIKKTAMLMGTAVSLPAIMGVLNGCTAKPTVNWKPSFFTEEQAAALTRLVDIIIPATDTPGASEVGVPVFIDQMYKDVYSEEDQHKFTDGLKEFNEGSVSSFGDSFISLSPEKQEEYTQAVHKEAVENLENGKERAFILKAKELTLLGFFTSEVGATQVLQYEAVPGEYKGCLPLEEVGKTWAT